MNTNKEHNKSGLTLLETIVAIALIFAAMAGPVTLIAHALFSASFSRNDLVAYTLAQEGIELVRAVRDNDILCRSFGSTISWDSNPVDGTVLQNSYEMDFTRSVNLTCGSATINTPAPITSSTCNTILNIDSTGRYSYQPGGTPTGFIRCVKICVPTNHAPCPLTGTPDSDIPASDQMEVISTVSWTERNQQKSIMLDDRLYNWE